MNDTIILTVPPDFFLTFVFSYYNINKKTNHHDLPFTLILFISPGYASLCKVIRRHLDNDLVTGKNADVVHTQLAGDVADYLMSVFELDLERSVGQSFDYSTFNFNHIRFGHEKTSLSVDGAQRTERFAQSAV